MRVGVGAQYRRIALHERFAQGVDEAAAQGHERSLSFPSEITRHVPHPAEFEIAHAGPGPPSHFRALAGGGVLAVRRLPATHAGGGDDGPGPEAIKIPLQGVKAHGAARPAVPIQKIGHQDPAQAPDPDLLQAAGQIARHEFAAPALRAGGIQLHMVQPALGHAFQRTVFLMKKFASEDLIIP